VTTRIYPDTRHECLNEINRDQVTADFVMWIVTRPELKNPTR
jgi:alpha-beta hydrolase superfamily lysophospholipase